MNIDVPVSDARRIEVVANGLPLWHGAQLAIDATIVSSVLQDAVACVARPYRPVGRHEPRCASRPYARRIEVVTTGVPLWHGFQLAVDATIVPP